MPAPVEVAHTLVAFYENPIRFCRTAKESASLRSRARELRGEFERALATMLAECGEPAGAAARLPTKKSPATSALTAAMLVGAWCVAFSTALRKRNAGATAAASRRVFRTILDEAFEVLYRGLAP